MCAWAIVAQEVSFFNVVAHATDRTQDYSYKLSSPPSLISVHDDIKSGT